MEELDGKEMGGSNIEVSLAKPPSDKKKKEEILRARERRMMQMMQVRGGWVHKSRNRFINCENSVLFENCFNIQLIDINRFLHYQFVWVLFSKYKFNLLMAK